MSVSEDVRKWEPRTDASGAAALLGVRNWSGVPAPRGDEASIIIRVDLFVGVSKGALSNFLFTADRGVVIPPILSLSASSTSLYSDRCASPHRSSNMSPPTAAGARGVLCTEDWACCARRFWAMSLSNLPWTSFLKARTVSSVKDVTSI